MLKEYRFSKARQELTNVFDDVQKQVPSLIKARKKSEEDGVFLNRSMLTSLLKEYTFDVEMAKENGEFMAYVSPINVYQMADSELDLRHKVSLVAREFAEDLIHEPIMFQTADGKKLVPYALRILLCDTLGDIEHVLFGAEHAEV